MWVTSEGVLKEATNIDIKEGTLNIPYGVTRIASGAIHDLPQLKNLIIPDTVVVFEENSVCDTGIVILTIPSTVKEIKQHAFAHNAWLTKVNVTNPDTLLDGTCVFDCRSITLFSVGLVNYNVRCLKYNVCYQILSKKMVDIYTVYLVEPFKKSANIGKVYIAVKQGICGDGTTIERAIEDCHRIYLTPNIIQAYKDITLDSVIDWHDYKRITGACDEGIIKWLKENGYKLDDTEQVRVIIRKLGKSYGATTFAQFVADRYRDRAEGGER